MRVKFCRGLTRTLEKREDKLIYCYYPGFIKLCSNWGLSGDKHRSTHKQRDGAGVSLMLLRHQNGILLLGKLNIYKDKDSKQLHPLSHSMFSPEGKNHPSFRTSRALRGLHGAKPKPSSSKEEKMPHTFYEMHKLQFISGQSSSLGAKYDYYEWKQINTIKHSCLPAFYSIRYNTANQSHQNLDLSSPHCLHRAGEALLQISSSNLNHSSRAW